MISSLIRPVNIFACTQGGTIFSSSGTSGGSGIVYTFTNLGGGAQVYAQQIGTNIQFRTLLSGNNVTIVQEANDITFSVEDLLFDSTAGIKRQVIGLQGVVLGKTTIKQTLQALLYPIVPPTLALAITGLPTNLTFEYGDNNTITANWTVTRTDEPIVAITVGGISQTVTGNTQSGSQVLTKTGLANLIVSLVATTATQSVNTSLTALVSKRIRYGGTVKDGLIVPILDADINAAPNSFFSANRTTAGIPRFPVIAGANYLYIEFPTAFSTPIYLINGVVNNAFTKVRSASAYVNPFGFSDTVDVWVSNQISPGVIMLEIF